MKLTIQNTQILVETIEQKLSAMAFLEGLGGKRSNSIIGSTINLKDADLDYKYVCISERGNIEAYRAVNRKNVIPFNELYKLVPGYAHESPATEIRLTDEYTALVGDTSVKVGCQTISFEAIEKVAAEVKRRKDSNA